ncbi:MAG TPA: homoserine dehydrogenase [Acidimicrobiales bacterium]|nr:homoserine dehydrogenase [Acidimicrobiales bacterium]
MTERPQTGRPVVRVGLLGCGNVGAALARLLLGDAKRIADRTGMHLELVKVAVRSVAKERNVPGVEGLLTTDAAAVVNDPAIDVVVEVMGGISPARTLMLAALKNGKPVVSANKELLANHGSELWEAAGEAGVDLLFEASVAGGIPLIRALRESLAGERIHRVIGIVNGTTNYILTRMSASGAGYQEALVEAQGLGYAERDPTADVEGFDAAAKAAILANVAFGAKVVAGDVYREGISAISELEIRAAARLGFEIKLLAIIEAEDDGAIAVRAHPAMVPSSHPLASVRDSFNAVFVEGDAVGQLMLLGRGAGGAPTASAVLGDLVDAAHNLTVKGTARKLELRDVPIRPIDDLRCAFYLSLLVDDQPGVLSAISGVLGRNHVSVRSMEQDAPEPEEASGTATRARDEGGPEAYLVFVTHPAYERDMQACLHELRQLATVRRIGGLVRVVGP